MSGKNRLLKRHIDTLFQQFPCVAILGARQVGKSTLLRQLLPKAKFFDLEKTSHFQQIQPDIEFFLTNQPHPLILDEAQLLPELFAALRVQIDHHRPQKGLYLLSGSSSPELLHSTSESLAGRIAIVELSPFLLPEAYDTPISPIYQLLSDQKWTALKKLKPLYTSAQILEKCFYGGYPEPFLDRQQPDYFANWMENYVTTYLNRDIRRLFPKLSLEHYQRFISMLAISSGQVQNYSYYAKSLDISVPTIKSYLTIAQGTFIWRSLPGFFTNAAKRLVKSPKGYLRDSGLLCYLNHISSVDHLLNHPLFGFIFESFVSEHLLQLFQLHPGPSPQMSFYRTHNYAEIDLILQGSFGVIPIEIKSGKAIKSNQLHTLKSFIQTHHCPLGIIINNADTIEPLAPNLWQIPVTYW